MKFIDDAIKESEERMEEKAPKKISSDIDNDLIKLFKQNKTNIFVVGAGGAGNNTISRLNEIGIEGATTITVNTDAQDLFYSQSSKKILLGKQTCGGLGAGGDPSVGEECAEETEDELRDELEGADMVFVTCGLGGGTGTGAAPVIAEISQDLGALTVGIVTKPFSFEGKKRMNQAVSGLDELKKHVDTLIVIPNDRLRELIDKSTPMLEAFREVDNVLHRGVQSISDLIAVSGLVNLDFADVKAIMKDRGNALIGIGVGSGENRATDAAKQAVSSPLLETSINGATDAIINVTGGASLTLFEVEEAAEVIRTAANTDINTIFGAVINENLNDEVIVTVIATGFENQSEPLYHSFNSTRREDIFREGTSDIDIDNDLDIPPFLRDRDNY